jgi:hypothetical protein
MRHDETPADAVRDETATLVKAFLASATSAFAPLVTTAEARWSVGVAQGTGHGFAPDSITHVFVATGSFSNASVAGEITFGDREYFLNTVLGAASSTHRFGLWEWADALDRPGLVLRNTSFVFTVPRLEAIVDGMALSVAALEREIARASEAVIARIEAARTDVQAAFQTRLRADGHRRAAAAAADAFRQRDFAHVVALLGPFATVLSPAERKRFRYAKEHL